MRNCEVCEVLKKDLDVIFDSKHWRVSLDATDQYYLGRSFVTAKRHVDDLAELSKEEWEDLRSVMKKFETAVRGAFGAILFNWSCLMNGSCQEKPYNPQVHWHVRPRYDKKVIVAGEEFADNEFGHHYARSTSRTVEPKTKAEIIKSIQKFL